MGAGVGTETARAGGRRGTETARAGEPPQSPPAGLKGGDFGRFQALGRVIDMHGYAVAS